MADKFVTKDYLLDQFEGYDREIASQKYATSDKASASADGLMSKEDYSKLFGIAANANNYSLPTASTGTLGGVMVDGTTVTIDNNGVISAAGGGGGGGASAIEDLTDVNLTSPTDGQILKYDGTTSKWVNGTDAGTSSLSGLTDTTISSPTNGQVLKYNSTSQKWVNSADQGGVSELKDLSDVNLSSGSFTLNKGNALLAYDNTSDEWVDSYAVYNTFGSYGSRNFLRNLSLDWDGSTQGLTSTLSSDGTTVTITGTITEGSCVIQMGFDAVPGNYIWSVGMAFYGNLGQDSWGPIIDIKNGGQGGIDSDDAAHVEGNNGTEVEATIFDNTRHLIWLTVRKGTYNFTIRPMLRVADDNNSYYDLPSNKLLNEKVNLGQIAWDYSSFSGSALSPVRGSYIINNKKIYRCNSDNPNMQTWTPSDWIEVLFLGDEIRVKQPQQLSQSISINHVSYNTVESILNAIASEINFYHYGIGDVILEEEVH